MSKKSRLPSLPPARPLNFPYHGDDDGAAFAAGEDGFGEAGADVFFHVADIAQALGRTAFQDFVEGGFQFVEHAARFGQVEHAARDQIGSGDDPRFFGVNGNDDHDDAVCGKVLAVAQHGLTDVADTGTVDHHVAAVRAADLRAAGSGELEYVAVLDDVRVLRRYAGFLGQAGVRDEHAVFAVDRDEVLRAHEVEHQEKLFLRGVSRDVSVTARTVDHFRAQPVEVVDRLAHALLVARDRRCANYDRVARNDAQEFVIAH